MDEVPLDSIEQFNNDLMYSGWTMPIYEQQPQSFSMFLPGQETDITQTELVYPVFSKAAQTNTKYIQMHGLLPSYGRQSFSGLVGSAYIPSSTNTQASGLINTLPTINMPINNVINGPINTPINSITSFQSTPSSAIASSQMPTQSLSASSTLIQPPFYSTTACSPSISIQQSISGTQTLSGRVNANVQAKSSTIDNLMTSLIEFMNKRGISINAHPYIGDQQINLAILYIQVMRLGGSHKVTQANAWESIAQAFGINLALIPNAGQQLAECYKNYLAAYEEAWIYNQQLLMQQVISNKYKHGMSQEKNEQKTSYNKTNKTLLHFQTQHALPSKSISPPILQSMSQPVAQPVSQPVSQPMSQSVSQPIAQSMSHSVVQPVSQPVAQSVSQPVSQLMSHPVVQSVSQPIAQSMSQPVSQLISHPVSQSMSQPVTQPVSQPVSQLMSHPVVQSVSQPVSQLMSHSVVQSVSQPVAQPVSQPIAQSMSQSVSQLISHPVSQSMSQPVTQPVSQPVSQLMSHSVVQPVSQPVAQPVSQPIAQSVSQPVSQLISHPVVQSVSQPVVQSMSQPVAQSVSQPVVQSMSQPVAQPVSQPVSQSMSQSVSQPVSQSVSQPISQPMSQSVSQSASLVSQSIPQSVSIPISDNSVPSDSQPTNSLSQPAFTQQYKPKKRIVETYGGFDMELIARMGNDLENLRYKPPALHELGTINIDALIKSVQSRLHSEVNRALDVLTIITGDKRWCLPLSECDELLDSIIEIADEEYQLLIPDIKNADETISISSYEQMVDLYYDEIDDLTINYRPGSQGYEKFRSMEKILCITTILRNLTFSEENQNVMAKNNALLILIEHLIILISKTNIFEISYRQRLDLAKDLIILLSNISQYILIDNSSTAIAIIRLITAFSPDSNICLKPDKVIFTPYNPTLHPYLPAAIDTLAKLFARSFPNRHTFAKIMIFLSSKQCLRDNIFIRTFMLCISPIPVSTLTHSIHICEARLALLEHCTLAAETIINIFPKEGNLAQSILSSDDSFLGSFLRLACLLSSIGGGQLSNQIHNIGSNPFSRFARRTMNILYILIEKAREEKPSTDPYHIFSRISRKEQLLGSLLTPHMDGMIIKNLWSLVEGNCAEETRQFPLG
ncbi:hypothetical protein T552_02229 [Pneumocystis carinii B80]|uniref:ARID domain-containing protein n=1 Tax=Pneumocystis carinii (strain B80) TaxID=1408658 RepID=A0A0W4ZHG1_PNEC8|nr:hypothetical protein T552_02229 [Pneumocystis carinii B80]KTW27789.1 hypothetical protein T552_02229 [Pneumocystis carinii B80]